MTDPVLMPPHLSDRQCLEMFSEFVSALGGPDNLPDPEILGLTYARLVSRISQPIPQQGWNDAIRAAVNVLDRLKGGGLYLYESPADAIAVTTAKMEALLDQQPAAWRDMESAPKDGTRVRLNFENVELKTAVWADFSHTKGRWCEYTAFILREIPTSFGTPTGWMPLPGDLE